VNASSDSVNEVFEITNGDLATTVFDASGSKPALESGPQYMSHGGKYVLVGLSKGDLTFSHPAIQAKETTMMCSRNATIEDFKNVISVIESGEFPVDSFITHRVHYSEMIANFDSWLKPETGVIKAMISF